LEVARFSLYGRHFSLRSTIDVRICGRCQGTLTKQWLTKRKLKTLYNTREANGSTQEKQVALPWFGGCTPSLRCLHARAFAPPVVSGRRSVERASGNESACVGSARGSAIRMRARACVRASVRASSQGEYRGHGGYCSASPRSSTCQGGGVVERIKNKTIFYSSFH
jgi:hypothetical protein